MLIIGFQGCELQKDDPLLSAISDHMLGGVILFDVDLMAGNDERNIRSPEQVTSLCQQLQSTANEANAPPLFISIDCEGGNVNRLKSSYGFAETLTAPAVSALTAPELIRYVELIATQLDELGINLNYAPLVDLAIEKDNPIIAAYARSFGPDPAHVKKVAQQFIDGFRTRNILSCAKHFPGHGSSLGDSHLGFTDITHTWQPEELLPYQNVNADMVMLGHLVHKGLDLSLIHI